MTQNLSGDNDQSPHPSIPVFAACFIALVSLFIYSQALEFEFLNWDDQLLVTENPIVRQGLTMTGLIWAFTEFQAFNWHPLTLVSHMLDVELFGLDPRGHHATSVIIHAVNAVLVYILLLTATRENLAAILVALLFAVHPTHVESVAWISERKDLLSTMFLLLAMVVYVQPIAQRKKDITVFVLLLLGLMCKPMLVSAPLLLLLLDIWPLRRIQLRPDSWYSVDGLAVCLKEKIPLFALAILFSVVTILAQSWAIRESLSLEIRLSNAFVSYARYLQSLVQPTELAAFYVHPGHWPFMQVLFSFLLVVALTLASLFWIRTRPYLFAGWMFFVIGLGPVIGLIQVGVQSMADRYLYIPSIGIFIVIVWLYTTATKNVKPFIRLFPAVLLTAVYSFQTWQYLGTWQNSVYLWRNAIIVNDPRYLPFMTSTDTVMVLDNTPLGLFILYNNIAQALLKVGLIDEAILHFDIAVSVSPANAELRRKYGQGMLSVGKFDLAQAQLEESVRLNPDDTLASSLLAAVIEQQRREEMKP